DIDLMVESALERLVSVHEREKAEISFGCRIDKDIDIRVRGSLIANIGTEQIKSRDAERPQRGLSFFQSGNNIIAAHGPNIVRRTIFSNAFTAAAPSGRRHIRSASASTGRTGRAGFPTAPRRAAPWRRRRAPRGRRVRPWRAGCAQP